MPIRTPRSRPNRRPSKKARFENAAFGRKRSPRQLSLKRITVKAAHENVCRLLEESDVPLVKKTLGLGIVRVCCRTIDQLKYIDTIVELLLKYGLVVEIGMPLEFNPRMKTLVLFIKPKDIHACIKLTIVFKNCSFGYSHLVLQPTAAEKAFVKAPTSVTESPTTSKTKKSAEVNKEQQFRSLIDIHVKEEPSTDEADARNLREKLLIVLAVVVVMISCIFVKIFLKRY